MNLMKNKTVVIVGGGALAHACAAVLGQRCRVKILTRKPELWNCSIIAKVHNSELNQVSSFIEEISSDPTIILSADIILFCLPGYAIESSIISILPYIRENHFIGSIVSNTGFFIIAQKYSLKKLFGFQRVPFIARVDNYGSSVDILGIKTSLNMATEGILANESFKKDISYLLNIEINLLDSFWDVTLSNSNPILHTARLFGLFSKNEEYDEIPYFYRDWTLADAERLIDMDAEFMGLVKLMKCNNILSLCDYYEVSTSIEMRDKIRSIEAFKNITSPVKLNSSGRYTANWQDRYFTEDFGCSMKIIIDVAKENNYQMALCEKVYQWGFTNTYNRSH